MKTEEDKAGEDVERRLVDQYSEFVQLVGGLAHEIKNPLSTIKLNLELLSEDFSGVETQRDRRAATKISVVQRECQRLQDLLDDFLSFARMRQLQLVPQDLNSQVARVLDFFEPTAEAAGIELVRYLDPDLPRVLIDPESFHASLLNLVINAEQSMPDGGSLVARTRSTQDGVALDLIDTGCGMDMDTLTRAFDAFYSTKPSGSGLGLPTTRKIIQAHGGTLSVQSEPNHGTQFTLALPTPPRIASD
ncbi:MAG: ATP-binding protein [Planctomycetota bacterium]|nr:ATP-binding protein [Planctomycetota bacterium]